MSSFVIARKTFRDNRTSTIGTGIAVIAMAVLVVALYPTYSEALKDFEMPGIYGGLIGEGGDISSPEGFLSIEFFSWIPMLVITMAVIGGTRALSSEEAEGTMDLLLAQPVSRRRLVLEKAAGLTLAMSIMVLVAIPSLVISTNVVGVDIAASKLVGGGISMLSLVLLFLMFSMWAAAAMPNRSSAVMLTVGVLVVSFIIHSLGASIEFLQTARKFFPFYWTDSSAALVHGMRWGWLIWTSVVTTGLLAGTVWSFNRRDIASGASDWSLRKLMPWRASLPKHPDREPETMEAPGA